MKQIFFYEDEAKKIIVNKGQFKGVPVYVTIKRNKESGVQCLLYEKVRGR